MNPDNAEYRLLRKLGKPEVGLGLGVNLSGWGPAGRPTRSLLASASIMLVGASSETGRGASIVDPDADPSPGTMWMTDARTRSYMMQAMQRVAARGINVSAEGVFANQANNDQTGAHTIGLYQAHDPRLTHVQGMAVNTAASTIGGYPLRYQANNECDHRFNITRPFTEADIFFQCPQGASGDFAKRLFLSTVGGGNEVSASIVDASVMKLSLTGLARTGHVLRIRTPASPINTTHINFFGMVVRDTTPGTPELRVITAAARGFNTTDTMWTRAGAYGPMTLIPQVLSTGERVIIECFGKNEDFAATTADNTLDAYIARIASFYDMCDANGIKVITLLPPIFLSPFDGSGHPDGGPATENEINAAKRAEAEARGYPVYDLSPVAGRRDVAIANGEVRPDYTHYKDVWHARVGVGAGDWLYDYALPQVGLLV